MGEVPHGPGILGADDATVLASNRQCTVARHCLPVSRGGKIRQTWIAVTRMLDIDEQGSAVGRCRHPCDLAFGNAGQQPCDLAGIGVGY